MRRVEDITEALWGSKVSASTISELNKKVYINIEAWRNRPFQGGKYPYVYVDGIYLKRNWGGEYENVAVLVAIAVNEDGYREALGAAEGMKEDNASWVSFPKWLRGRGLKGVKLIVGGNMDIIKARDIVRTLADGVDPTTGEILPADSVYNSPDVIRALFTLLEATSEKKKVEQIPNRNAGKPWTEIEDDKLRDEFASKMKIADIAKEHGRTYGAIESRLDHLGLKKKPFWLFGRKRV